MPVMTESYTEATHVEKKKKKTHELGCIAESFLCWIQSRKYNNQTRIQNIWWASSRQRFGKAQTVWYTVPTNCAFFSEALLYSPGSSWKEKKDLGKIFFWKKIQDPPAAVGHMLTSVSDNHAFLTALIETWDNESLRWSYQTSV